MERRQNSEIAAEGAPSPYQKHRVESSEVGCNPNQKLCLKLTRRADHHGRLQLRKRQQRDAQFASTRFRLLARKLLFELSSQDAPLGLAFDFRSAHAQASQCANVT